MGGVINVEQGVAAQGQPAVFKPLWKTTGTCMWQLFKNIRVHKENEKYTQ